MVLNRTILGRKREIQRLESMLTSNQAELFALYGRRRVGKTFLVREFFKSRVGCYLSVTGIKGGSNKKQLSIFQSELERTFFGGERITESKYWHDAFTTLIACLKQRIAANPTAQILVFLDELPWLAGKKSDLLSSLDSAWNTELQYLPQVKVVLCGSAASWMIKNLINAKGGLYNRLTGQLSLNPLSLGEVRDYLQARGFTWSNTAVIETYMIFGGIPYYLSLLDPHKSLAQNVGTLCFQNGDLSNEKDRLFEALFGTSQDYRTILEVLAKHRFGLTRKELLQAAHIAPNGVVSKRLRELQEAGFIAVLPNYGTSVRHAIHRLSDEFLYFTFTWVAGQRARTMLQDGVKFWMGLTQTQAYKIWSGYAFETLCLKHHEIIQSALGFSAVQTTTAPFRVVGKDNSGFEIDLLFDRADKVITLVEIKCHDGLFILDKQGYAELQEKKARFLSYTKTTKTVQLVLLSRDGVQDNEYSRLLAGTPSGEVFFGERTS